MKCDACGRERADEQLSIHRGGGIKFCRDLEDCHAYRKEGRYFEIAQEVIDLIISGQLLQPMCAEDAAHGCVVVWSSGAQEQIAAHLAKRMRL